MYRGDGECSWMCARGLTAAADEDQLTEFLQQRPVDRPVVIAGDVNPPLEVRFAWQAT
jgi:hypothetical protein